jgi:hypothetical protein
MQSILAFHNPVHGIKQMIDGHLVLLNRTIREGIEAGRAVPNPEPESTNQNIVNSVSTQEPIVRTRSLNDLSADTTPTFIMEPGSRVGVYADDTVNSVPTASDVPPLNEGNVSYHHSFIPAPEQQNLRRAGGAIDGNKTGFTTPAFQEPKHLTESYRGPL